ncbi:shikimate dehydrogenase [Leifsonia shinshuensis]|uniref:shikimate dehydrogenase n=1 Tax=Leifsonia shinshuensis TaxID=150026 RepID=UPI001F508AAC|nr:shikimate dehydrogenase [Leifsonia shinshuensis]MCI0155692.1 shikimate dehydrogenase [Leifsonia shinshuensis]
MDEKPKTPSRGGAASRTPAEAPDVPAEEASVGDGVSEASAEAEIAALVEAEREVQAEEAAIVEAEAAADSEEPLDGDHDGSDGDHDGSDGDHDGSDGDHDGSDSDHDGGDSEDDVDGPAAEIDAEETGPAAPETEPARRLAVLGSPIGHSRSPALHRAAYDVLGLPWSYESVDVAEDGLATFLDGLGPEWRGLSLTMPLKQTVVPLLTAVDRVAVQTGVANTVLLDGDAVSGFNTDVAGIVRALGAAGLQSARYVHVLGGGATAASALVAAAELGAERVDVHVRDLQKSLWLEPLAHELGLMVRIRSFAQADRSLDVPELVISTLPGGASTAAVYTDSTRRRAVLLDVAYDPWPSALGRSWQLVGGKVVSGLAMLAHQALLQVRIFVSGDPLQPLPDEDEVLGAMLTAVGIDAEGAPLDDGSGAAEAE